MQSDNIQKVLLTKANLTLDKAVEISQGMEAAAKQAKELKGSRCPNGKRPIQITSGGRKRINELRPGGRMSPSNIVRWDAIHR